MLFELLLMVSAADQERVLVRYRFFPAEKFQFELFLFLLELLQG